MLTKLVDWVLKLYLQRTSARNRLGKALVRLYVRLNDCQENYHNYCSNTNEENENNWLISIRKIQLVFDDIKHVLHIYDIGLLNDFNNYFDKEIESFEEFQRQQRNQSENKSIKSKLYETFFKKRDKKNLEQLKKNINHIKKILDAVKDDRSNPSLDSIFSSLKRDLATLIKTEFSMDEIFGYGDLR